VSTDLAQPAALAITGRYFDGRQALSSDVTIAIAADRVRVEGAGVSRNEPLASVSISERIGRTPRFIRFSDQAYCEILDHAGFDQLLARAGLEQGRLTRWEQSGRLALALIIALVVIVVVGYRYGLPLAAEVTAKRLPAGVLNVVSRQTLSLLDRSIFSPTELPESRQRELSSRFLALTHPASPIALHVIFRSSEALGANAMALPNGTIVVTDGLVKLATNDDEVMAVLAHEAGHVEERHGLRNVIQSSVVSILISWYLGDVNAIVAAAPAVLMDAKYSRDLEREADDYAARFLAANNISRTLLGDMLQKLEQERAGGNGGGSTTYLSSHPTTKERIDRLRSQ
jgi:Zn-dependent protease with chaperone function